MVANLIENYVAKEVITAFVAIVLSIDKTTDYNTSL